MCCTCMFLSEMYIDWNLPVVNIEVKSFTPFLCCWVYLCPVSLGIYLASQACKTMNVEMKTWGKKQNKQKTNCNA